MDERSKQKMFERRVILAPLTKGGNLPFRQLCVELGATVTMGEMAMAHKVVKQSRSELALLRRAEQESCFGVQLAGRNVEQLAAAAKMAEERGADFVDLNLGCPIDLLCQRGIGAALMQKPTRVRRLIEAMVQAVDIPVTAKIRLGFDEAKPRYREIGRAAQDGGASAVTLHGRSRKQRYRRAANWEAVGELADLLDIPVIGNGDLLSYREVEQRWKESGCASVMLARGALMKPWLFREIADRRDYLLTPEQRLRILQRYVELASAHFGEDERGQTRVREFLTFHLDFFNRYRPVPSTEVDPGDRPFLQTRQSAMPQDTESSGSPSSEDWLNLLYSTDPQDIEHLVEKTMTLERPLQGRGSWLLPIQFEEGAAQGEGGAGELPLDP